MIRWIGYLIAAYITMRCVEIFSLPDSHFRTGLARRLMLVIALMVLAITAIAVYKLSTSDFTFPGLG